MCEGMNGHERTMAVAVDRSGSTPQAETVYKWDSARLAKLLSERLQESAGESPEEREADDTSGHFRKAA